MTNSVFNPPIDDRYFEDYIVGSVYEFGSILVEEKDILDFAQKFDPQTFHVDKDKAKKVRLEVLLQAGGIQRPSQCGSWWITMSLGLEAWVLRGLALSIS